MGTVVITGSGFANLPASAPANWPSYVTWPTGQSPNGTKTYTVSDADWVSLLTWTAAGQFSATVVNGTTIPAAPTAAQILLAWLQIWVNGTKNAVQQFFTGAPSVPTQIGIS